MQQPSFLFVPGLPDKPWWERNAFPFLAALEDGRASDMAARMVLMSLLETVLDDLCDTRQWHNYSLEVQPNVWAR